MDIRYAGVQIANFPYGIPEKDTNWACPCRLLENASSFPALMYKDSLLVVASHGNSLRGIISISKNFDTIF